MNTSVQGHFKNVVQFYIIKTRSKDLNGLKNYLHINGEGNEKYIKFKRSSVTRQ